MVSKPPCTQRAAILPIGKDADLIGQQLVGRAVFQARLFAILCSVFWLGDLAVLAPALFGKDAIGELVTARGITDLLDTIKIQHVSGRDLDYQIKDLPVGP